MEVLSGELEPQQTWISREYIVWSQDPSSLGDVLGGGFFLRDDMGLEIFCLELSVANGS